LYVAKPPQAAYEEEVEDEGGEASGETKQEIVSSGGNPEVDAILGLKRWPKFSKQVQAAFYEFARRRRLPQNKDVLFGVYEISEQGLETRRELRSCDFWRLWLNSNNEWKKRLA